MRPQRGRTIITPFKRSKNLQFERRVQTTPGDLTGIPDSVTCELHYEDYFGASISSSDRATYVYRGNSLYDPDFTSVGHQPRYFDTYSSLYTKYKVLGSTMHIDVMSLYPTASTVATLVPLTDIILPTTFYQVAELPRAKVSQLIPVSARWSNTITSSVSTSQILGITRGQLNDEDYSGTASTNPNSVWYWNIGVFLPSVTTTIYNIRVKIIYQAIFYDRIEVEPSFIMKNPEDPSRVKQQLRISSTAEVEEDSVKPLPRKGPSVDEQKRVTDYLNPNVEKPPVTPGTSLYSGFWQRGSGRPGHD
jgi:hypothetical protein